MKIGVTFNVRSSESTDGAGPRGSTGEARRPARVRDDDDEEFDSPETIRAMAEALAHLGHEVELLGYGEPLLRRLLDGPPPDLVWNIAEGHGSHRGREARVPAVLEMLGIPYTGSDPLTLAATLDKDCAKRLVAASGVATPAWVLFTGDFAASRESLANLRFPLFVKPAYEGSSKGILATSLIKDMRQLEASLTELHDEYAQPVLVEEFIDGDELTVGIVGNRTPQVIGVMRISPRGSADGPFVYSLEVKRDWRRRARYECPARLSADDMAAVERSALACWQALGCRDVARVDFRLRDGVPYFLEANPLPGLSPESGDLVLLSRAIGIEYSELIARILQAALERTNLLAETPLAATTRPPTLVNSRKKRGSTLTL